MNAGIDKIRGDAGLLKLGLDVGDCTHLLHFQYQPIRPAQEHGNELVVAPRSGLDAAREGHDGP